MLDNRPVSAHEFACVPLMCYHCFLSTALSAVTAVRCFHVGIVSRVLGTFIIVEAFFPNLRPITFSLQKKVAISDRHALKLVLGTFRAFLRILGRHHVVVAYLGRANTIVTNKIEKFLFQTAFFLTTSIEQVKLRASLQGTHSVSMCKVNCSMGQSHFP